MYNTSAISTHVCQIFNIFWEVNFYQIFLKYAIPTHFNILKNILIICRRTLEIWSILCMRDDKMHQVKLTRMFSNVHMMLMLIVFLAKPMFRINKPLFISKQTMDVTWKNILGLVINVFPTSLNNINVAKEYKNNIPWCGMEYALRFLSCSPKQAHLLMFAYSPISIIDKVGAVTYYAHKCT